MQGFTPLLLATARLNTDAVASLLEAKAKPDLAVVPGTQTVSVFWDAVNESGSSTNSSDAGENGVGGIGDAKALMTTPPTTTKPRQSIRQFKAAQKEAAVTAAAPPPPPPPPLAAVEPFGVAEEGCLPGDTELCCAARLADFQLCAVLVAAGAKQGACEIALHCVRMLCRLLLVQCAELRD